MSIAATLSGPVEAGWLRNARFDINFIVGTTVLAVVTGWVVVMEPSLFTPVLLMDLWLLGQHHVISTWTRLCFCKGDLAKYRFLVFVLPVIVLGASVGAGFAAGWWILGTTYFYWQWFHYTRQSWGVAQFYRRKAGGRAEENELATKLAFYLPPLWGILHRSWQAPTSFLGLELKALPVPELAVDIAGVAAVAALCWWAVLRVNSWRRGDIAPAHLLYMASHHVIFFVGYLLIKDVTFGWLVINIWHNAQYVLFVWLQNNKRFEGGIDPDARSLSTLCQSDKMLRYFGTCLAMSTLFYVAIKFSSNVIGDVGLPLLIVIYLTTNFHHYIVDGIIWKSRKGNAVPAPAARGQPG